MKRERGGREEEGEGREKREEREREREREREEGRDKPSTSSHYTAKNKKKWKIYFLYIFWNTVSPNYSMY